MTVDPLVIDIIVATMIIAFAVINCKKGLFLCAASVAVIIISLFLAIAGANGNAMYFMIILVVALVILTLLKKLLSKIINKIPVIGWLNRAGGFVFGIIEAVIILLLIIKLADFLEISFFRDIGEDTILLNWLMSGDYKEIIEKIENIGKIETV